MSLLLNVITPSFTVMVADTKSMETINEIPTGVTGCAHKLFRINEYVIIGTTGEYGFSESVIANVKSNLTNEKYCDQIAHIVSKYAIEEWAINAITSGFIVSGICSDGSIRSLLVHEEDEMKPMYISSPNHSFGIKLGIPLKDDSFFDDIREMGKNGMLTIDSAITYCKHCIDELSISDDRINNITDVLYVST